MTKKIALTAWIVSLLIAHSAYAYDAGTSLYSTYSKKSSVKTWVMDPEDGTLKKEVMSSQLKAEIEKALQERKSVHFLKAGDKTGADISIQVKVSELWWTDQDPVDMIVGVGGVAMDAAVREDYVRMTAFVDVLDAKTERSIWQDKVMATITKKDMPQTKAFELINAEFAKEFVQECFGKRRALAR